MESSKRKPDVEAIMARIRRQVKSDISSEKSSTKPYISPTTPFSDGSASPLLYSEELNFLNANWHNWNRKTDITSHRKILGPVIVRLKRFLADIAWNYLLKDYFENERRFQMNLVRHLNSSARYIDARDSRIFWQLVNKLDNDVKAINERTDKLFDELFAQSKQDQGDFLGRVEQLESDRNMLAEIADRTHQDVVQIDGVLRGIENNLGLITGARDSGEEHEGSESNGVPQELYKGASSTSRRLPLNYFLLQNRFQGPEEGTKEDLQELLKFFSSDVAVESGTVVQLGCGRGEFLELLAGAGVRAFGVDADEAMTLICRDKGLSVAHDEGLNYLKQLADGTLGGLVARHYLPRLDRGQIIELIAVAARKVRPGGKVIFEASNPQSFTALSSKFFRDPSNQWPLHPETLRFMMESNGIKVEQIVFSSPVLEENSLRPVTISPLLPPAWQQTFKGINENLARLNEVLFGNQSYIIVGVSQHKVTRPGSGRSGEATQRDFYPHEDEIQDSVDFLPREEI